MFLGAIAVWILGGLWANANWDEDRTPWDNMAHWLPWLGIQALRWLASIGLVIVGFGIMQGSIEDRRDPLEDEADPDHDSEND